MTFEYKTLTTSVARQPLDSAEKKQPSKPTENTVGLQILVHLSIDSDCIEEAVKGFADPLDVNKKTDLATVV